MFCRHCRAKLRFLGSKNQPYYSSLAYHLRQRHGHLVDENENLNRLEGAQKIRSTERGRLENWKRQMAHKTKFINNASATTHKTAAATTVAAATVVDNKAKASANRVSDEENESGGKEQLKISQKKQNVEHALESGNMEMTKFPKKMSHTATHSTSERVAPLQHKSQHQPVSAKNCVEKIRENAGKRTDGNSDPSANKKQKRENYDDFLSEYNLPLRFPLRAKEKSPVPTQIVAERRHKVEEKNGNSNGKQKENAAKNLQVTSMATKCKQKGKQKAEKEEGEISSEKEEGEISSDSANSFSDGRH